MFRLDWRLPYIVLAILLSCWAAGHASVIPYALDCDYGKGATQAEHFGDIIVTILHVDQSCHVEVRTNQGELIFSDMEHGIQVSAPIELSRGERYLIVQIDRYPYLLKVLRIGARPALVATLSNNYGYWIQDDCTGRRSHIWTADGVFAGDPELNDIYHYDLLVPEAALYLDHDSIVEDTANCRAYFENRVAHALGTVKPGEVEKFKAGSLKDEFRRKEIKGIVLYAALTDLYCSRRNAAKAVIDQQWPPEDAARIWKWMLEKHRAGLGGAYPSVRNPDSVQRFDQR